MPADRSAAYPSRWTMTDEEFKRELSREYDRGRSEAQEEISRLREALGELLIHIPNEGAFGVLRRYKEAAYAALRQ